MDPEGNDCPQRYRKANSSPDWIPEITALSSDIWGSGKHSSSFGSSFIIIPEKPDKEKGVKDLFSNTSLTKFQVVIFGQNTWSDLKFSNPAGDVEKLKCGNYHC